MLIRRMLATVSAVSVVVFGAGSVSPAPAGAAACYAGTWTLSDASASRTISTPYGRLVVTPVPGGAVTLTIAPSGTWQLSVNKSFLADGTGPIGTASGTVAVDATASGTYRPKTNGALVFRLGAASGTASFTGTVNGSPLSYSYTLVNSDVQRYLGIKGKAVPTCSPGPHLALRFRTATLSF